jgi:transcriptional regulator with XRE-family HTH domain
MNLKIQLKILLELNSITAAQLARQTGVSKQVLSLWLSGAEPKSLTHVKKVAEALNTTVDHLCFGNGHPLSPKILELEEIIGSGLFEIRLKRVNSSNGNGS